MKFLDYSIKNYSWGKLGNQSIVSQLYNKDIKNNEHYAELWIGTHIQGPSRIKSTNIHLKDHIQSHLHFLFKVLSVDHALSIQVHPSKIKAKSLHKEQPNIYKDPNSKPEMCYALTNFKLLCGFRKFSEISSFINTYPEFKELTSIDSIILENMDESQKIKEIFNKIMNSKEETYLPLLNSMIKRIKLNKNNKINQLILKLNLNYKYDVGLFMIFVLNLVELEKGESLFLGENILHSYLEGDCLECMSNSDNVIRCALTNKYKDFNTLSQIVSYKAHEINIMKGKEITKNVKQYDPLETMFYLEIINIEKNELVVIEGKNGYSTLLVINGSFMTDGVHVGKGQCIFLDVMEKIEIIGKKDCLIGRCIERRR